MMMESSGLERAPAADWRRSAGWLVAAVVLLMIAGTLAWFGAQHAALDARQLAIMSELQLGARDVSALSSLAAGGNQKALTQSRDRAATLDTLLTVLMTGGTHQGETIPPLSGSAHERLKEFSTHWAEFKRRVDTLAVVAVSPDAQTSKERRAAEKRPTSAPAPKTGATRSSRDGELGASALSLVNSGHGLAGTLDGIRAELDGQARTPWLQYLAMVCLLGAMAALSAFAVSVWRRGQTLEHAMERGNTQLLEALRPAMDTLHVPANAATLANPVTLGRRLSDEVVVVIDGVKTLVKALDTATAEADKFAVVGHVAARALATAEQKAVETSSSLQATARRIAAVYTTLSANGSETQSQCEQLTKMVDSALAAMRDCVRSGDPLRERFAMLTKRYTQSATLRRELGQSLFEVADLLTQADGFALRAGDRLAAAGPGEAVAFANDIRTCLASSVTTLKKATELAKRGETEADEFANELTQVGVIVADQCRTVANSAYVLANAEGAVRALSSKLSSMTRLASATEGAQLLSALDESVRQIAQSSASAREVLDATQNAANRIEDLAKLLNTMKPS